MPHHHPTVFAALSGGVDSSVAALLLRKRGYRVVGVYMKNWSDVDHGDVDTNACPWEEEWAMVQTVGTTLGIETRVVNFEREYRERVIRDFASEYASGRTPNPDIACNREIKFDVFANWAFAHGADVIATGHHVRRRGSGTRTALLRGVDQGKDQSYFLYAMPSRTLSRTVFPVGEMTKSTVRAIARANALPNAQRRDSQGICFIGPVSLASFLGKTLEKRAGDVIDRRGNRLGRHTGVWSYTIGQRQRLGVTASDGPYYVSRIEPASNTLVVTKEARELTATDVLLRDERWLTVPSRRPFRVTAQPRYRAAAAPASVSRTAGGVRVRFDEPQRALTPGQSLVFYDGARVLGGGIVETVIDAGRFV